MPPYAAPALCLLPARAHGALQSQHLDTWALQEARDATPTVAANATRALPLLSFADPHACPTVPASH